jgi:hypothetical protein
MRLTLSGELVDVGMALGYIEGWAAMTEVAGNDPSAIRGVASRLLDSVKLEQPARVDVPVSRFDTRAISGVQAAFDQLFHLRDGDIHLTDWIDDHNYEYTGETLKRLRDNCLRAVGAIRD